eukprot:Clim_evm72s210 gene=Clim_evmTU72s210
MVRTAFVHGHPGVRREFEQQSPVKTILLKILLSLIYVAYVACTNAIFQSSWRSEILNYLQKLAATAFMEVKYKRVSVRGKGLLATYWESLDPNARRNIATRGGKAGDVIITCEDTVVLQIRRNLLSSFLYQEPVKMTVSGPVEADVLPMGAHQGKGSMYAEHMMSLAFKRAGTYVITAHQNGIALFRDPMVVSVEPGNVDIEKSAVLFECERCTTDQNCSRYTGVFAQKTEARIRLVLRDSKENLITDEDDLHAVMLGIRMKTTFMDYSSEDQDTIIPQETMTTVDWSSQGSRPTARVPLSTAGQYAFEFWYGNQRVGDGILEALVVQPDELHTIIATHKQLQNTTDTMFTRWPLTFNGTLTNAKGDSKYGEEFCLQLFDDCVELYGSTSLVGKVLRFMSGAFSGNNNLSSSSSNSSGPPRPRLSDRQLSVRYQFSQGGSLSLNSDGSLTVTNGYAQAFRFYSDQNFVIFAHYLYFNDSTQCLTPAKRMQKFCVRVRQHHARERRKSTHTETLNLDRAQGVDSFLDIALRLSEATWVSPIKVKFANEMGMDYGGISREYFCIMLERLFDPAYGLFIPVRRLGCGEEDMDMDIPLVPNTARRTIRDIRMFELTGRIFARLIMDGIAMQTGSAFGVRFSWSMLSYMLQIDVTPRFLEIDDPELYEHKFAYVMDNDVSDLDLTFSEEIWRDNKCCYTVDLKPGGRRIPVTEKTKHEYLDLLLMFRMRTSIKRQLEAFTAGFESVLPRSLWMDNTIESLDHIFRGEDSVEISHIQRCTLVIGGGTYYERSIEWFWLYLQSLNTTQRRRYLQFVTGSPTMARNNGRTRKPILTVRPIEVHNRLPTARTCFNTLYMPTYDDYNTLKHYFDLALTEGATGFGIA